MFVRWATERLVVVVAHNDLGHDPVEVEGGAGEKEERCSLHPGLVSHAHLDAAVDVVSARGEGLAKIPFVEPCPNTWLVSPDGQVVRSTTRTGSTRWRSASRWTHTLRDWARLSRSDPTR